MRVRERLKATTSQIYQCMFTHAQALSGTLSEQGIHKWKISWCLSEPRKESTQSVGWKIQSNHSMSILLSKRQILVAFLLQQQSLKISSTQSKPMQMATKVDRNATVSSFYACGQKRMKTLFLSPETSIITITQSQPRHLQLVECLCHTLPSEMPPHYRILAKVK